MFFKSKWAPLFATNFLSVFNDNFLKGLICYVSVAWVARGNESTVISVATSLLVVPYIFFSPLAGRLAKTKSKRKVLVIAKQAEIAIMLTALLGFMLSSLVIVMSAMLLLGIQSSLFSPSKYGLIRDIGGNEGISYGTGVTDMTTFTALLLATSSAGVISDMGDYRIYIIGILFITAAGMGWYTSVKISANEPPPDKSPETINPVLFVKNSFLWAKSIKGLNYVILASAFFWLIGTMFQLNLIVYCPEIYNMTNTQTGIIMALVAVGVGLGCWVAGIISKGRVELGLITVGGIGLSTIITLIAFVHMPSWLFISLLIAFTFFCGFYKVPIYSWIQRHVEGRKQGDILGYNNTIDFLFVLIGSGVFGLVAKVFNSSAVFIAVTVCCWFITAVAFIRIPKARMMFLRFIYNIIAHIFFRIRVKGKENIPAGKGAIIVGNHVSFLDSFFIVAAVYGDISFILEKNIYDNRFLNWFFRLAKVIPVNPDNIGKQSMLDLTERCRGRINAGAFICMFPEGRLTRTGQMGDFNRGVEFIAEEIQAPVIPVYLGNVFGIPFSYHTGTDKLVKPKFSLCRREIYVNIGEPLSCSTDVSGIKQKIAELQCVQE